MTVKGATGIEKKTVGMEKGREGEQWVFYQSTPRIFLKIIKGFTYTLASLDVTSYPLS